jgi:hypothetical protein
MTRTPLFFLAAVLLLIGGYWYFFTGTPPSEPLTASEPVSPAEQQFIDLSGKLSSISFDTSIFSDPRLLSLTNPATPIAPENKGRKDPFAPIGH